MDRFESQRRVLAEQICRYSGAHSDSAKSIGITLRYPVFSDFTPDQLAYYLYWRDTVGKASFKKAPDGYTWLLVCEIINKKDHDEASKLLNSLCTAVAKDGSPLYPELLGTAIEFALFFGTPLPAYRPWMGEREELSPWILSGNPSDPPSYIVREHVSGTAADGGLRHIYGRILREYSSALSSKRPFERCFLTREKRTFIPFKDFVYLGERVPLEAVYWVPDKEKMGRLFESISEALDSGRPVGGELPCADALAEAVGRSASSEGFDESPDPFSKTDAVRCRKLGSPCTDMGPSYLSDTAAKDNSGSVMKLGDILTFSSREAVLPARFVTSDLVHPTYDDLSREQFGYFIYWRGSFRKGRYLDTDEGYTNLFLDELINSYDTAATRQSLVKLLEVYGNTGLIAATLVDHTLLCGEPFSDYRVYQDKLTVNSWIDTFVNGRNTAPLDIPLLNMMRSGNLNVKFIGCELPLEPLAASLRSIFREVGRKKPLTEALSASKITAKRSVYVGLHYFRGPKECTVTFTNYLGSRKFTSFIDKAAKYASLVLENLRSGQTRKLPPFSFGGVNCASILQEEFSIWYATVNRPRQKEVELDMAAVETAESDLRMVTEMMRVDEPPEEPHVNLKEERPASDDPWGQLFLMLDRNEKEYLRKIAAGSDTADILKSAGASRIKMDDRVNSKSLDTVGDTVVEDGRIVEDYLEEIKKGLEW